uniref:Fanconi anemia, complementation group M n=1 Tax=Caenorhabditis tropicalis TaxID=1561998 RepID=A0A1I7TCF5_9PELO
VDPADHFSIFVFQTERQHPTDQLQELQTITHAPLRSEGEENGTDDDEFFADSDEETSDEEPEESDVDDAEMNKRYSNETVSPLSEPSSSITDT